MGKIRSPSVVAMGGEFLGQIRLGKWGKISSGPTPGDLEASEVKGCTYILCIEP
jgi:hypothetical protein